MKRESEKHPENFRTFGFEIYDYSHIAIALAIIVFLLITWSSFDVAVSAITLFKEMVSLILSVILIMFIAFIAENEDPKHEKLVFTFCWVIAGVELFIPASFDLVYFFANGLKLAEFPGIFIADFISMACPIVGTFFLGAGLFNLEKAHKWMNLILVGIIFILVGAAFDFLQFIFELIFEEFSVIVLLEAIVSIAPLAPAIYCFRDFKKLGAHLKEAK